ncbi:chorismate mutase aro7 [Puccinia graminis f. sp. tritici]|uniref:Chorismate mutase n=2 Tax=Puccinia graminis f. sp. tritici TaxID=56615 RepID=E3KCL5_PUCGT|nr:chorismate mutase [Puccinia graminis f. sp. tritici CRL 75-36-700-3]EFP82167.2 chorismate mutase [Puccinia graminis f. sp. tritici CRL 75-36-700-3]KAA1064970.1 chorismate mutase aro7 [Puccinia graminis f. sp. tritici]
MEDLLDLQSIRRILMRLEDTITFLMIERAQFAHNQVIYENSSKFTGLDQDSNEPSFLGWMLRQTETTHAKVRRYEAPDEYPFTPKEELPQPILPMLDFPRVLHPNKININSKIKEFYINNIVPVLTKREGRSNDDGHYGSSATRDVEILQAVSRRIHYGKFVAESKFRDHPQDFIPHIRSRNSAALENLITKPAVEVALIERLSKKALTYGQEISDVNHQQNGVGVKHKMDAKVVVEMYKNWVIPLTRQVEVEYLLCRLDGLSKEELARLDSQ